jgi:hypothetical protein
MRNTCCKKPATGCDKSFAHPCASRTVRFPTAVLIDRNQSGVFFVALAPVSDPNPVVCTIATSVGVVGSGEQPLEESKEHLRDMQLP